MGRWIEWNCLAVCGVLVVGCFAVGAELGSGLRVVRQVTFWSVLPFTRMCDVDSNMLLVRGMSVSALWDMKRAPANTDV